MKLDELRGRLRAGLRAKPVRVRQKRLRCSKCRGPREAAKLTDPDVARILVDERRNGSRDGVLGAYRCRVCRIIWIVCERSALPPMHPRCRSKTV
jgi:hypothetical protein